jgi:hypothetical protein
MVRIERAAVGEVVCAVKWLPPAREDAIGCRGGRGERAVSVPPEEVFDYVVVGGGTAGCVVAARLSEDPSARVLLLERGDSPISG